MKHQLFDRDRALFKFWQEHDGQYSYEEIGRLYTSPRTGKPLSRARVCQIIKQQRETQEVSNA